MELVRRADVVHHNMTKGTAARRRLDYQAPLGSMAITLGTAAAAQL